MSKKEKSMAMKYINKLPKQLMVAADDYSDVCYKAKTIEEEQDLLGKVIIKNIGRVQDSEMLISIVNEVYIIGKWLSIRKEYNLKEEKWKKLLENGNIIPRKEHFRMLPFPAFYINIENNPNCIRGIC